MRAPTLAPKVKRWALALGVMAVALLALACGNNAAPPETGGNAPAAYHGFGVDPALPKPDITLTDTSGSAYRLRDETAGYVTLLFFGYTHCPDICPTHLATIAAALDTLPDDVARRVKVVFITTDPARDTPERIRAWLDTFNPEFIGLTGTQEEVDAAQTAMGVPLAVKEDLGNGNYAVSHSALVFAFTTDDRAHVVYPFGVRQSDWTQDLPKLVKEGWTP